MDDVEIRFDWQNRTFSFFMRIDRESVADQDMLKQFGAYNACEPELSYLLCRALRPGDLFVDGGACTGYFTLLASALGAVVVAFEPARENMIRLQTNLTLNNIYSAVLPRPEALWSSKTKLKFTHDVHAGQHSLGVPENPVWAEEVATAVLDDLSPTPRVIKLDVEGAEEQALRGAVKHLADQACPYIVAECNLPALEILGSSQFHLRKFMISYGYDTFLLHKDGSYPSFLPQSVIIDPTFVNCNLLFSTPAKVMEIWRITPIV